MKRKINYLSLFLLASTLFLNACKDNEEQPKEGIQRSELIFTEITGEGVYPHGDHFHGLNGGVEGETFKITFDDKGNALTGAHVHVEAETVYRIELKAWDYTGKEVQNDFIASKAVADGYKAFFTGGNFVLNTETDDESGAIFQTRDLTYGDGTAVSGQFETTGITSYFIAGHDNEGPTVDVAYILRKLEPGVKPNITRLDWNAQDYQTRFAGTNVLDLRFELHVEEGHGHDH